MLPVYAQIVSVLCEVTDAATPRTDRWEHPFSPGQRQLEKHLDNILKSRFTFK